MLSNNEQDPPTTTAKGTTLRKPVQVIKKRSGPLEDALDELHRLESSEPTNVSQDINKLKRSPTLTAASTPTAALQIIPPTPSSHRRRPTLKDKEKKRERWLLTRKTWKYMTDAGRKLIPDGVQNRKEDIPKIEAHFQHICSSEQRFVLWRRKASYPGATRNSRRRLKQLLRHTGRHALSASTIEQEEASNACQIIELLQTYLKLDESFKTTTLLGSKTVRPDQTASPSAQRPRTKNRQTPSSTTMSLRGPGFLVPSSLKAPEEQLSEIEQLLSRLKTLSRNSVLDNLSLKPESITPDLLQDKALLKQIYNTLKKQQLHRILSKHSSPAIKPKSNLSHAASLSTLFHFGGGINNALSDGSFSPRPLLRSTEQMFQKNSETNRGHVELAPTSSNTNTHFATSTKRQRQPPTSLDLNPLQSESIKPIAPPRHKAHPHVEKQYNNCSTQTSFIQLGEIKRLAEEYKERKREEDLLHAGGSGTPAATDDEAEKSPSAQTAGSSHSRRKSSIDNEDVSQSVSDTIKRYLRMARKKSVHDADQANRFKRVNYDRNLRNIRAKGEINPPGMDDGLDKAIQTLDAWPLIQLEFIRGNENSGLLEAAHSDWQRQLNERIQKKLEFEQKMQQTQTKQTPTSQQPISSCSSPSAPTSPISSEQHPMNETSLPQSPSQVTTVPHTPSLNSGGGNIFSTGSQFLANLWHGNTSSSSSTTSPTNAGKHQQDIKNAQTNMQKSKSSTNVGQFVTRKILRSRSRSQTRAAGDQTLSIAPKSTWAPTDNFRWISDNGDCIQLTDTSLQKLSEIETKLLQRVAIEKINELNLGIHLNCDYKAQKRRILPKKKAITTSFFDIGKKDDQSGRSGVFGTSLDCCIANDRKRCSNLNASSDRGSRSSLVSLFRSSGASSSAANKLNENVRSCESLPSTAIESGNRTANLAKSTSGYFSNLRKSATSQMSRSQIDMRRKSQEFDMNFDLSNVEVPPANPQDSNGDFAEAKEAQLLVPAFVSSCIKYLEESGLSKVGLFRVSTSKKRIKQMREDFDKSVVNTIDPGTCPHDVATLLKEFLRDLPEPLLCSHLYKAFLETQRIRNRRLQLEGISHLIKLLPATHRDTLFVLLKFLAKVAASSDDVTTTDGSIQVTGNKMDSNNLATVFAPNILRVAPGPQNESSKEGDLNEKESMSDAINVIRIMIDHYEELFKVSAELMDVVYSHMMDECPESLYSLCEKQSNLIAVSSPEQEQPHSSSSTTPIARRLYTRESVMHHNDASKTHTDVVMNGTKDTKRHFDSHNTSRSSSHSTSHNDRDRDRLSSSSDSRRQSNPNLLDAGLSAKRGGAILSASLQIAAPNQQVSPKCSSNVSSDPSDQDDVFYDAPRSPTYSLIGGNFSDYAFIDDTSPTTGDNFYDNSSVSASLALVTNVDTKVQQKPKQSSKDTNTFRLRKHEVKQPSVSQSKNTANEPKLPASITNIGGAILRSKTADFERKSSRTQIIGKSSSSISPSTPTSPSQTTTSSNQSERSDPNAKQHLYKRQQLIPSAKRFHMKDSK